MQYRLLYGTNEPPTYTFNVLIGCGKLGGDSTEAHPKIVGGKDAKPLEFPWQVSLRMMRKGGLSGHFCGGSLITDKHVLTAAHCVQEGDDNKYAVIVGDHQRNANDPTEELIEVQKVKVHPRWDSRRIRNDVAVLTLARRLNYTGADKHLSPICLPKENTTVPDDEICTATGWGRTEYGGDLPKVLQKVNLPIVSTARCQSYYDDIYPITVQGDKMICAGYDEGGRSTCHGDSGGPLQCPGVGDRQVIVGVTSWGVRCAGPRRPGVFARVTNFLDFIHEQVQEKDEAPSTATCPPCPPSRLSIVHTWKGRSRTPNMLAWALSAFFLISTARGETERCGIRGPSNTEAVSKRNGMHRIVGGDDAQPLEFPWQVSLRRKIPIVNMDMGHTCGGSIISDRHILTAAHCVDGLFSFPSNFIVTVGDQNIYTKDDSTEDARAVRKFKQHPLWDSENINYDYAILTLQRPLDFDGKHRNLMPICLPKRNESFDGKTCTASGWGLKGVRERRPPAKLQKVDLPILPHAVCRDNYKDVNDVRENTMICAGYKEGGKSVCMGDSGGPLQCQREDGRYELAGVTSWGVGCAGPEHPGVFSRVSTQLDFIEKETGLASK
ncbi:transmembrane protease serine 9-like [Ornithodoros turicata]|uniref:transmembrane protease serine 9-like n=1 Tax=Ornithodoros turicata TaxID=34597 RepID=UPI0031386647